MPQMACEYYHPRNPSPPRRDSAENPAIYAFPTSGHGFTDNPTSPRSKIEIISVNFKEESSLSLGSTEDPRIINFLTSVSPSMEIELDLVRHEE